MTEEPRGGRFLHLRVPCMRERPITRQSSSVVTEKVLRLPLQMYGGKCTVLSRGCSG